MRREAETAHVALVALSGHPEPASRGPFDAYMQKPIEILSVQTIVLQLASTTRQGRRGQVGARSVR
jgi:hypothetical protein